LFEPDSCGRTITFKNVNKSFAHNKPKNFNMSKLFAVLLLVAMVVAVAFANPNPAAAPAPGPNPQYLTYGGLGYGGYGYPAYGGAYVVG